MATRNNYSFGGLVFQAGVGLVMIGLFHVLGLVTIVIAVISSRGFLRRVRSSSPPRWERLTIWVALIGALFTTTFSAAVVAFNSLDQGLLILATAMSCAFCGVYAGLRTRSLVWLLIGFVLGAFQVLGLNAIVGLLDAATRQYADESEPTKVGSW